MLPYPTVDAILSDPNRDIAELWMEMITYGHVNGKNHPTVGSAARDMLDKSLSMESGLGPEQVEEEVDADELATEVTLRLGECNSDLNLLADVFGELDDERKSALLQQLRYSIQLVEYLESRR